MANTGNTTRIGRGPGRGLQWIPLGLTFFGMSVYMLIDYWLALKSDSVGPGQDLAPHGRVIEQVGALLHFRAIAAAAVVAAFASVVVTVALLLRYGPPLDRRRHLILLLAAVATAVTLNVFASSGATKLLLTIGCPGASQLGVPYAFCTSTTVIGPWLPQMDSLAPTLNLRQLLNLPMAAAAACIGYVAFMLAATAEHRTAVLHEKLIALVIAFGGAMMTCVTLLDREYARWAFSAAPQEAEGAAVIDGLTLYSGASSSGLLAMIWLFAMVVLAWRRGASDTTVDRLFSRQSAFYSIVAVIAPIALATVHKLF